MDDSSNKDNSKPQPHHNNTDNQNTSTVEYHLLLEDDINNASTINNKNIIRNKNRSRNDTGNSSNPRVSLLEQDALCEHGTPAALLNSTAATTAGGAGPSYMLLSPLLPRNITKSNSNNSLIQGGVSVHNDDSTRIYFQDDARVDEDQEDDTSLPSTLHQREDDDDDDVFDDTNIDYADPNLYSTTSRHRHRRPSYYYNRNYARLNRLNYLNAVTFLAHLFVSWGIGIWGLDGAVTTRWYITTKYETLVTPAVWAYYLWAPILVLEGLFAAAQLLPHYRNRPVIQAGTGCFFFYTTVLQTAWTLFFSFRLFTLSFVSVILALLSLLALLASQRLAMHNGTSGTVNHSAAASAARCSCFSFSLTEYLLFRFPFHLHAGWMILMTVDHLSLIFRFHGTDSEPSLQVAVDIFCLAAMLAAGAACLFFVAPSSSSSYMQDFVIPAVIIWSYIGIASRLGNPSDALLNLYGHTIVDAMRYACYMLAGTLGSLLLPCIVIWLARELCVIHVVELE